MKSNVADNDMEVFRVDKHRQKEGRDGGWSVSEAIVMLAPQNQNEHIHSTIIAIKTAFHINENNIIDFHARVYHLCLPMFRFSFFFSIHFISNQFYWTIFPIVNAITHSDKSHKRTEASKRANKQPTNDYFSHVRYLNWTDIYKPLKV